MDGGSKGLPERCFLGDRGDITKDLRDRVLRALLSRSGASPISAVMIWPRFSGNMISDVTRTLEFLTKDACESCWRWGIEREQTCGNERSRNCGTEP